MSRSMHINSLAAFDEIEEERSDRAEIIYALMTAASVPMTDRQVMQALGFSDMNMVRPRITELKDNRWAMEVGSIECPVTNRHVRLVKALNAQEREALIERQRNHWRAENSKPISQLPLALA